MKRTMIATTIVCITLATGLHITKVNQAEQELIKRIYYSEYNPRQLIHNKLDEYNKEKEYNQMIETKQQQIISYLNSYEYKLRESTRSWRTQYGISIDQLQPIQAELSYYSDLPQENGIYGLKTASGVDMNNRTVANNFLPFETQVYIDGYGMKEVHDRGSKKYFTTSTKFDVYVPRNPGENNSDYFKRVNAMGRKTVQGYIIKQ